MLTIKNLSHTYPNGKQALKNLSLEISKGMFGLLGPNGAGKSTLMKTLATLQIPTQGEIRFDGFDIINNPIQLRKVLGYLPQEFGVYPRGSAFGLLNHLAVLKGITHSKQRKQHVYNLLEQTNLLDVADKNISTYSGGMRQRFGIAQALIGKPKLIIVDEPTAGLDPEERQRFHNLLSEIGEEIVVILSTHIVDDVADLCPNMAILSAGEIVVNATPKQLIQNLKGKVWKKVINKTELAAYQKQYQLISHHLSEGQRVIRVKSQNCPTVGFKNVQATLEDIYFIAINETNHSSLKKSSRDEPLQVSA